MSAEARAGGADDLTIGDRVARTTGDPRDAEIVNGYLDGLADDRIDFPATHNRSALYRHGWLNGRDDRVRQPRASAQQIRRELSAIYTQEPTP